MDVNKTILIAEQAGNTPGALEVFASERGFDLLKADNLRDVLLTLQENRIDSLVLDAALLAEDCGFISVIKGMEKDLPIIVCAEKKHPRTGERNSKISDFLLPH